MIGAYFPHSIDSIMPATGNNKAEEKRAYRAILAKLLIVLCTKFGQSVVDLLHIAEIKAHTKTLFSLTLNSEGVKTQSFFDAVLKFNWLARRQRDSGKVALRHRKMKGREGRAGVLGKTQIRGTGTVAEGKLSPEALNRFIRLAVSPEPE
jgi:hypothetical protein